MTEVVFQPVIDAIFGPPRLCESREAVFELHVASASRKQSALAPPAADFDLPFSVRTVLDCPHPAIFSAIARARLAERRWLLPCPQRSAARWNSRREIDSAFCRVPANFGSGGRTCASIALNSRIDRHDAGAPRLMGGGHYSGPDAWAQGAFPFYLTPYSSGLATTKTFQQRFA